MKTRPFGPTTSGRRHETRALPLHERLARAVRPGLESVAAGLRAVSGPLTGLRADVRERLREPGGIGDWLEGPAHHLRSAGAAVSEIATDAYRRVRAPQVDPADHLDQALRRIVLDATTQLVEARKDLAIHLADRKRLSKLADSESSNAGEQARLAALADERGDEAPARLARMTADEHERRAERARSDADELTRQIESLADDLRTFQESLANAKSAVESLRSSERMRETRARARTHLRRIEALAGALEALSDLQELTDGQGDQRTSRASGRRSSK